MSELKVLTHIGNHLNILNVLGAVTKDINQGKLLEQKKWLRDSSCKYFKM